MRRGPCSAKPAVCALRRARVKSSVSCAVPPLEEAAHPPASAACAALATPARLPHPRGTAAAPHPHSALAAVPRSRSDPRLNAPPVRSTWTSTSGATCAARLPGSRRPHAVGCCPSTAGSSIPTMRPRRSRGAPRPQPGPHGRHAWPARPTRLARTAHAPETLSAAALRTVTPRPRLGMPSGACHSLVTHCWPRAHQDSDYPHLLRSDSAAPSVFDAFDTAGAKESAPAAAPVPLLRAPSEVSRLACFKCGEPIDMFYDKEASEWMLRDAVTAKDGTGRIGHSACLA